MADKSSYSADVKLWLDCGGHGIVPLAQTGDTFVIAKSPKNIPPCDACVVVSVDGRLLPRNVTVVEGIRIGIAEVAILSRDEIAPF